VYDPRYLEAGTPEGDYQYELGAIIQGVDLGRFLQRTNTLVVKSSVTSQASHDHQLKAGVEYQLSKVEFGTPGHLVQTNINGVQTLAPRVNDPPDYPDPKTYHPLALSAFGQDQIEWNDLTLRAGVRMDYFNARATLPSDLANPANAIAGAPHSVPRAATAKTSVSPRLGVSYPISTSAALFFSYGHFYQFPGLGTIFGNSDYTILKDLQAGIVRYGVMGNPDIKPERTIQYEFGYKQAVNDLIGVNFSIFYKDIRDLLGVEFVSTYTAAEYARLTNVDFGNVYGFTLSLDQRRIGNVTTSVDYTWQQAQGNSSDPRETATRAEAGEDPRPRQVPLNWDQRHTLNVTVQYGIPDNFSVSTVVRFGSGQPYTPSTASGGFGAQLEPNSAQKSSFVLVDLRGEKSFRFGGLALSLFARVFNLFDSRFSNGFVFSDTGSPDYSLNPVGDRSKLADPLRYYQPRRVEIGVSINNGL
jgi:outer membrane receptor protein involved in Fe transport